MSDASSEHFGDDFFRFLKDLEAHNDRAWFTANKERYAASVQGPSLAFIRAVGPGLKKFSPRLVAEPKPFGGSLSRIYRDVRFSKDKSPYRTNVGIHFWYRASLGKEEGLPGFYLHLSPGESFAASGAWRPEPPALKKIRDAIVERPGEWKKVLAATPALEGESLVRVPKGYAADHAFVGDLRRRDFIASIRFRDKEVTDATFPETFLAACRELNPLNRFLAGALGLTW